MTQNTNTNVDLTTLKMGVLVAMVNALGGTATMKTFSQRSKAVERINKLAAEQGVNIAEKFDLDTGTELPEPPKEEDIDWSKEPVTITREEAGEKPLEEKPAKEKKAKEPKETKPKRVSIRSVAEALILEVTGLDENKRKVGHSYEAILAKIKEQYPDAKTSIACLRWYAVHMRERGTLPPSRPRAVPAKTQPQAEVSAQKPEA